MNIESVVDFEGIAQEVPNRPTAFDACEGHYILNEQGEPVAEPDFFKWAEWFEESIKTGARRLAEDTVGPYWVSTVFLGLDHGHWYNGEGPPVLWETMIFGAAEKDIDQFRYTSKAEALAGHARAVKLAESLPHSLPDRLEDNDESSPDTPCPGNGDSG